MNLREWTHRRYQSKAGKSKFRQDGTYQPKDQDQCGSDWRDLKGFAKDQAKHRTWCKCRRFLKEVGNRQNRRWSRKMIHNERFDELFFHQDMFISSWDAC